MGKILFSLVHQFNLIRQCRTSQLGYCIRDSPKFHLISVKSTNITHENDQFIHRILQCPIQRYRMSLSSFDWNYFDENRLVLLGGKEYFDYVIPSRSNIVCSSSIFSSFNSHCFFNLVLFSTKWSSVDKWSNYLSIDN